MGGAAIAEVGSAGVCVATTSADVGVGCASGVGAGGAADGTGGVTRALTGGVAKSARASVPAAITITPPHTEHRARTLAAGILAGSTRNTERHSEQVTFMERHLPERPSWVRRCA